jgi:t-SNARE complex subunit (syntaxin)
VLSHFAPSLATAFMSQVAGGALRSDMEYYAEPVRKFVTRIPNGKVLLDQALAHLDNPQAQKEDVRRKFLQQLMVAKSSPKQVKTILVEMWSRCKGVPAQYSR